MPDREPSERRPALRNVLALVTRRLDALPTLRPVLARLRQVIEEGGLSARETAALVGTDAALTAKVLKVINAPFYGRRYRISTLGHALAMLGPDALQRILDGFASLGCESAESDFRVRLWEHGLATAFAARAIAGRVGYDQPDEAYLAGLLHDLGKIVLDRYAPEDFQRALRTAAERDRAAWVVERELFGVDHGQVGALVADSWNLPKGVRDAIRHHHDHAGGDDFDAKDRELLDIVVVANDVAHALLDGAPLPPGDRRFGSGARLSEDAVRGMLELVRLDLKHVEIRLAGEATPSSTLAETLRRIDGTECERPEVPLRDRLASLVEVIESVQRIEEPDAVLLRGLEGLQESLGFDRVLYLARDPGGQGVVTRYVHDGLRLATQQDDVALGAGAREALRAVEASKAVLRVERGSDADDLLDFLGSTSAVVGAITIRGDVDGLVLADAALAGRDLDDDDAALLRHFVSNLSVMMENKRLTQQTIHLRQLAEKDELMGIYNRRSLMQLFEKEVERARRSGRPMSVIMIDVDRFKRWNDVYGHQVGDAVLRDLAQLIVQCSREVDVVGRYGGDEFLVVLSDANEEGAIRFAERLRVTVEKLGLDRMASYPECRLTISMGVAELDLDQDSTETVIQRVDRGLYSAKDRGRNQVQLGAS